MCLNCGFIFAWKIKVLITPFLKQILAGEMKEDIKNTNYCHHQFAFVDESDDPPKDVRSALCIWYIRVIYMWAFAHHKCQNVHIVCGNPGNVLQLSYSIASGYM